MALSSLVVEISTDVCFCCSSRRTLQWIFSTCASMLMVDFIIFSNIQRHDYPENIEQGQWYLYMIVIFRWADNHVDLSTKHHKLLSQVPRFESGQNRLFPL